MLTRKPIQLLIVVLVTFVAAAVILLDLNIPLVRPLLAIYLLLAVGHTTLLAWANHLVLRGVVRALMTVMLGITLMIISGLILNFTTWGIETRTWVFFLSAIILINSVVALLRKQTEPSPVTVPQTSVHSWKLELHTNQIIMLALAVIVTGASLALARNGAINQSRSEYSQLWMIADSTENASQAVLGVKNEEQQPLTYRLVVMQGTTVIQEFPAIALGPDETWQGKIDLKNITEKTVPVEALLYRGDEQSEPYRNASLWLQ